MATSKVKQALLRAAYPFATDIEGYTESCHSTPFRPILRAEVDGFWPFGETMDPFNQTMSSLDMDLQDVLDLMAEEDINTIIQIVFMTSS